jgi:type II secretory pathway component PulK
MRLRSESTAIAGRRFEVRASARVRGRRGLKPALPSDLLHGKRSGLVLLAVLVVIVILTLAAYQFSQLMTSEAKAADSAVRAAQARSLARSGVNYAAALLSNPDALTNTLNGNPYDNPAAFRDIIVQASDQPRFQGRFSIAAPLSGDDPLSGSNAFRFGVMDESGKINLNTFMQLDSSGTVLQNILMNLPNMTEDVANSIIDWIDSDDEPRSNGAENDYYSAQSPPYQARNGPPDSLEELLLVKGVTPQLLFGNDLNRNGVLDPEEDDGSGTVDRGWSQYLTVYGRERNVDSQGNQRIYVNESDLNDLSQKLTNAVGADLANYIIAYRLYGPAAPQGGAGGGSGRGGRGGAPGSSPMGGATGGTSPAMGGTDVTVPGRGTSSPARQPTGGGMAMPSAPAAAAGAGRTAAGGAGGAAPQLSLSALGNLTGRNPQRIASLYDLINSQVSVPSNTPNGQPTTYSSPLNDQGSLQTLLPLLLDEVSTVNGGELPARINVNTAPSVVLAALPGLSDSVQTIVSSRPDPTSTDPPDPIYQTPAWLIIRANLSPQTLKSLDRYITAGSQVYRVQSIGYFDGGGPSARVEAVIDTNAGRPRIIYFRDLTELGKGFKLQNGQ